MAASAAHRLDRAFCDRSSVFWQPTKPPSCLPASPLGLISELGSAKNAFMTTKNFVRARVPRNVGELRNRLIDRLATAAITMRNTVVEGVLECIRRMDDARILIAGLNPRDADSLMKMMGRTLCTVSSFITKRIVEQSADNSDLKTEVCSWVLLARKLQLLGEGLEQLQFKIDLYGDIYWLILDIGVRYTHAVYVFENGIRARYREWFADSLARFLCVLANVSRFSSLRVPATVVEPRFTSLQAFVVTKVGGRAPMVQNRNFERDEDAKQVIAFLKLGY